jgi:putative transposase
MMQILKAYKYRIYPTEDQEVLLNKTFGCCRVVWNACTEAFNSPVAMKIDEPKSSTEIKKKFDWMSEVSAAALQSTFNNFFEFKKQFFSKTRKKKVGRPKFKSKNKRQAYSLFSQKFNLGSNFIRLEKIGRVKVVISGYRPPKDCNFRSVTVSKDPSGKFFVSVLVKELKPKPLPETGSVVGIDVGIKTFAVFSDGTEISNPKFFSESQAELRKAQKSLSRKKKGSTRRRKARLKVALIHEKIRNQRKHFHHEVSRMVVNAYSVIGLEDLTISGMVKNRKLSKVISDAGWAQFVSFLSYKAEWAGRTVQKVGKFFPSSKLCSCCGSIKKDLTLADRSWVCDCGVKVSRDLNASINIKNEAIRLLAQGVACA